MKRWWTVVMVVAAASLLGLRPGRVSAAPPLGPTRALPDASVPDAGLRFDAGSGDGGSTLEAAMTAAAAQAAAQAVELAQLREQVQALRERTAVLEDRVARVDGVTNQLGQLIRQVEALRTDVSEAATARESNEHRAQQHAADVRDAINGLMWAESQLATGSSEVGSQIDRAQSVLTSAQATYDLGAARAALANHDLAGARLWLYQAIVDAQLAH